MKRKNSQDLTKERILDTAEVLFAQKGYQAVSVREITSEAECNLAAVNYHFGNKENLYLEVFRSRWVPRAMRVRESFRKSLAKQESLSEAKVVRALAKAFVEGPLSDEERLRHSQLMTGEMTQPSEAFEHVAEQVILPFFKEVSERLDSVLTDKLGGRADAAQYDKDSNYHLGKTLRLLATPSRGHNWQSTCMRNPHLLATCALSEHPHVVLV